MVFCTVLAPATTHYRYVGAIWCALHMCIRDSRPFVCRVLGNSLWTP